LLPKWGGQDMWAWMTPPFNARYVGVIYLGALVPLVIFAVTARWSPGRIVLWMIFVFTAVIMVVMFAYADRFEWPRLAPWGFWALYLFLPVNSAVFLWRLRDLRVPEPLVRMPTAMTALALVLGGYGIALLAIPEDATRFWPWPVDAFHARIYAATYLTPAVGALVILRGSTPEEIRTLAATLIVFGIAAVLRAAGHRSDRARSGEGRLRRRDVGVPGHQRRARARRRRAVQRGSHECSGRHAGVRAACVSVGLWA
jgi:hypothetical protein